MTLKTRDSRAAVDLSFVPAISTYEEDTIPAVTAVIPAYNEAKTIGGVLDVVSRVECLDRIFVVDDGSNDGTIEVVQTMAQHDRRVAVIRHPSNHGKGQAVFTGWRASRTPILLMLDADLIALTPQHVYDLVNPVLQDQADMTLGLFQEGHWNTDLSHKLTPWLTGQRCLKTELYRHISIRAAAGYGLETAITVAARQHGWRCRNIAWRGVTHLPSEVHRGFLKGIWTRTRMYASIVAAWFLASSVPGPSDPAGQRK